MDNPPRIVPAAAFLATRWLAVPLRRQRVLYGLLPLLWALLLARYLPLGMVEAGQLLPVSLTPLAPDLARALRDAVSVVGSGVPSTKGTL